MQPIGKHQSDAIALRGLSGMITLIAALAILAVLYFGREIFVPLALATLLSFALAPMVTGLRRWRIGRTPSVIIVVTLAFLSIFAFGSIVARQVGDLAVNLPVYQRNIEAKVNALQDIRPGEGFLDRVAEMMRELRRKIAEPPSRARNGEAAPAGQSVTLEDSPIPVEIRQPEPAPLELLQRVIGPMIEPLTTGGIVIVFVVFMLLQREDLRDRLIRLAGSRDIHRTTEALDEAARRVAHYLLLQLVVNAAYGIPVGIGLWLIGVPNPMLWGLLAIVLRFVPYIGPVVAAAFPLILAVAVDPGWTMLLWTAALFVALEVISGNIIEPWLYGSSTGLSPLAIIVAAIFWTWLWGPIGLLLSTPLTVCLVVLGRHVPQLEFLNVLLGSDPVLTPAENVYQRLLVGDPDEATERADEFLVEHSLAQFYDTVAIPALRLAERDRARGQLDEERRARVAEGAMTLVDNLAESEEPDADDALDAAPVVRRRGVVLCIAGRGNLDEAAGAMLAQLLQRRGVTARIAPHEANTPGNIALLDLSGVSMVCLSYMNTDSMAHARYLVRRWRRRLDGAPILLGFWGADADDLSGRDPREATGAEHFAATLTAAVDAITERLPAEAAAPAEPAPAAAEPVPA